MTALTLANAVLLVLGREALTNDAGDLFFSALIAIGGLLYVAIGLLIAVRARSVIGWFLTVVGVWYALLAFGSAYGAVGIATYPGSLPAAKEVATAFSQSWIFALVTLTMLLLVFPDGRPPSPRWRSVLWMAGGGAAASYVLFLLKVGPVEPVVGVRFPNPFAAPSLSWFVGPALVASAWVTVIGVVGCFAGLIVRYRRGDRELRQQIKWLGLVAAAGASCIVISGASLVACGCDEAAIAVVSFTVLIFIILLGVPGAIAVAVFRYRLYDLDLVVSKALVYGILAGLFTLVYVGLVIGVGTVVGDRGNSFLTILTAVAIAVAFQPVRERVRHLANRIVYGKRATPYEVLSEFSDKVASSFAAEDVLPRMAQILASGTGASSARVWLRFGEELRPAASWPENGLVPPVAMEGGRPRWVRRGRGRRRGPPPRRAPRRALGDDAAERSDEPVEGAAGPRPRGAGRARASQRPADRGAPRLAPPDRHGAGRARQAARTQPARRRAAAAGRPRRAAEPRAPTRRTRRARDGRELRCAAAGGHRGAREPARPRSRIYPPLLADQGLVVALEGQARKAALPVKVEGEGIGRYPQEVEAAVYFCCLEALQNVAKYANASTAHLRLADRAGTVTFEVSDDGTGFDPEHTPLGTGLQGMRDRLEALGGTLTVESSPAGGTMVLGSIPSPALIA